MTHVLRECTFRQFTAVLSCRAMGDAKADDEQVAGGVWGLVTTVTPQSSDEVAKSASRPDCSIGSRRCQFGS